MKHRVIALAAALLLGAGLQAAPVDAAAALKVASHFWNAHRPADVKPNPDWHRLPQQGLYHLHVFAAGEQGFVIVAADDCVQPVLAYAFDAPFPEVPHPALRYWLQGFEAQIAEAVAAGYKPSAEVAAQWTKSGSEADSVTSIISVPMMLSTRWDQSDPYNQYCPYDSTYRFRTVVGCSATAMAQIMKYWNYPTFGTGSHSYTHYRYGTLSADFGNTTYLWASMPYRADMGTSWERRAVALLSYHCGVSIDMSYGQESGAYVLDYDLGDGSTWPCVHRALVDYFKYSDSLSSRYRDAYDDSSWLAMIDTEMVAGRPMLYVGYDTSGGHAFVLDGADTERRYHFNWGWSGAGDGFYAVNNLAPNIFGQAGGNATYTFNLYQGALFGIQPGVEEHFDTVPYRDSVCTGTRTTTFREHTFFAGDLDTLLVHLDTVFQYHLSVIPYRFVRYLPNGGNGHVEMVSICQADGLTFPECMFSRRNCAFVGWCHDPEGNEPIYRAGEYIAGGVATRYYAIWNDTTVGIVPTMLGEGPSVWPMPASEVLHVAHPSAPEADLLLLDAVGRTCFRAKLRGGRAEIPLSALPSGVYILQLSDGGEVFNRRIIKQ